jgi:transcriptional regulator with XRE-family HTH domain
MPVSSATARTPDTDEVVRGLLNARRGEWESIARKAGVSYSWVSKFMNDHIPNPGNTTLRKLRAWLEANPPPGTAPPCHAGAAGNSSSAASPEPPA